MTFDDVPPVNVFSMGNDVSTLEDVSIGLFVETRANSQIVLHKNMSSHFDFSSSPAVGLVASQM